MDDLSEMQIERHCLRLMTAYNTYLDARDVPAFLALYTEDAVWARTNPPVIELNGHAAIAGFVARMSTGSVSRHLLLNPRVDVHDADHASGVCYGLVVRGPAGDGGFPVPMRGVELLCEYHDRFQRLETGWRITRREMTRLIDVEARPQA